MNHDWRDFWKMVLMWAENQLISETVANKAASFIQSGMVENVIVQLTDEDTRTAEFNHDGTPGEKMAEIKAQFEAKEETNE